MNVAFLLPLDGIFAAKACSLNHRNKVDPSQSFDSSEMRLSPFSAEPRFSTRGDKITTDCRQAAVT